MAKEISLRAETKNLAEPTPQEHIVIKQAVEILYDTLHEKEVVSTIYLGGKLALKMENLEMKTASLLLLMLVATFVSPSKSSRWACRLIQIMNQMSFGYVWLRDITPDASGSALTPSWTL
eukprot:685750-Amphidinium_carterae.1